MTSPVTVRTVSDRATVRDWIRVPDIVFADDPAYVAPLRYIEKQRIARAKSPFFRFADVELFVAYKGRHPVGRISAQINRRYLSAHPNATGHFGFFATTDEFAVARALLEAAKEWLTARGMTRIEGPFSFSINEECGILIDHFETPPAMLMAHSRPWQFRFLEDYGFEPAMEMYSFRMPSFEFPEKIKWLANSASSDKRISVRSFQTGAIRSELALMVEIFNEAWSKNWGFVPLSVDELEYAMRGFLPFMRDHYGKFVLLDGRPVGFVIVLPDLNSIIAPFNGRLLPFNWLRLWRALTSEHYDTGRMPLLGLRQQYQGTLLGSQLFATLLAEHHKDFQPYLDRYAVRKGDIRDGWIELSWVLATNKPLLTFLRSAFPAAPKTYRIYGKQI